ncbi:tetratricopeptide repeat protein, partial [Streptomyces lycii]|uniref:tetratricopeptide repeat protein n=1 Tax=Streptomyces lycii TaxID=2654337 RepID=UPI001F342D59
QTASSLAGCSLAEAQSLLDELAGRCLLRPVPGGAPAPARYDLPGCLVPLLREDLAARVKPAEAGLARARMLERTVRQLRACRAETERDEPAARAWLAELPRGLRFGSRRAAREWLDSRLPVLRAAVRLAVDDGGLDTQARRLLSALARAVMAHRGEEASAAELYPLHQLALEVAERRGLVPEQAAAHLNLADLDAAAGRTEDALARYRSALAAAREAEEPFLTARSLESLGRVYQESGDWERAADWYGRALGLRLARGDAAEEARLYGRMATVHEHTGDRGETLRNLRAAAAAARRAGDRSLESGIRTRLAGTFDLLGDADAAAAQRAAARRLRGKAEQ